MDLDVMITYTTDIYECVHCLLGSCPLLTGLFVIPVEDICDQCFLTCTSCADPSVRSPVVILRSSFCINIIYMMW